MCYANFQYRANLQQQATMLKTFAATYHANIVDWVVEWLKRRAYDQHGLGSKPTDAILLGPWERHFMALFPTCWSWQAVQIRVISLLNYKGAAISWHLRK